VIAARCGLRLKEVPVVMRQRLMGQSSLTLPISIYYSIKVLVAVVRRHLPGAVHTT